MPRVLLIEADCRCADAIRGILVAEASYTLESVGSVAQGVARLGQGGIDAVLLGFDVGDAAEVAQFDRVAEAADSIPILVMTGEGSEDAALQTAHGGTHAYLPKSRIDGHWLPRALRHVLASKALHDELARSAACFAAISEGAPLGIFVSDAAGHCIYTNSAYQRIAGLTFEAALGTQWREAVHPDDRAAVTTAWDEAIRSRVPFRAEHRFLKRDGSVAWARVRAVEMELGKRHLGYVQMVEDITERKAVDQGLPRQGEQAQSTLDSIVDGIITTDTQGDVAYLNPAAEALSGWSSEEAVGKPFPQVLNLVEGAAPSPGQDCMAGTAADALSVVPASDGVVLRPDGSRSAIEDSRAPIRDREGNVTGGVMVFHDVTESRAIAVEAAGAAGRDALTGLLNRSSLDRSLKEAMDVAAARGQRVALLLMDIDQFKDINDSLGHGIGDKLLQSIAARLVDRAPAEASIGRFGGDVFAIVLPHLLGIKDAVDFGEALCATLALPHQIARHELRVTASIGVAVFPEHGRDVESIYHHADTAMYHAKDHGRNQAQLFRREMSARATERLVLESRLHRAMRQDEFVLHYQPTIDLATGSIVGAEALIRWQHPDLGLVPPGDFIPVAEACGLIVPLGKWVLEEACRQGRRWLDSGFAQSLPIAVNVSATQFEQPAFLRDLVTILDSTGLDPHHLELELTESVLMVDAEAAIGLLKELSSMGIRLAVDDFGTGYSSLSYLKQFAIDTLKIDRSFIKGITIDADDATIVSSVIRMARGLGHRVVAEGIENEEQIAFLQNERCHDGQGYYFSRPLALEDYMAMLADSNGSACKALARESPSGISVH